MKTSKERFLTTHVGSMIRPEKIRDYTQKLVNGESIDVQDYEASLREEVDTIVRFQADAGVDVVSDGEFGKSSWAGYVIDRVSGFEWREGPRPRIGVRVQRELVPPRGFEPLSPP